MSAYAGPADWWTDSTDAGRTHIATKGIVRANLALNLDAGANSSYPGSGNTWIDLTGTNANAAVTDASITYSTAGGGSVVFSGAGAILTAPVAFTSMAHTIGFWIYLDDTIDWNTRFDILASNLDIGVSGRFVMYRFDTTTIRYQVVPPSLVSSGINITGANTLFTGKWKYVVITSETVSTTTTINIYLDGTFYSTVAMAEAANGVHSSLLLMRNSLAGTYPVKGKLAETTLYTRALTSSEIKLNFNILRGRFGI